MHIRTIEKIEEVEKFIEEELKIYISTGARNGLTINIVNGDELKIVSPIFFVIGERLLIELYDKIQSYGFFGKIVIKSLIDAIKELKPNEIFDLKNNCFIKTKEPGLTVWSFITLIFDTMECQKVKINKLNKNAFKNIWLSFGRYKGCKALFNTLLVNLIMELRRIHEIEEDLMNDPFTRIDMDKYTKYNILQYIEYNPCLTCQHCIVKNGRRYCKVRYISIPKNMSIDYANKIYTDVKFRNGILSSKYICHNIKRCVRYESRIGIMIK